MHWFGRTYPPAPYTSPAEQDRGQSRRGHSLSLVCCRAQV